jgi:hypothetical protein
VVVPEFCLEVAPTRFIRQLVEQPDPSRVIVSYDWVSACLSQDRLLNIDTYKLRSSPLGAVGASSRKFNQYRPSDLISIQLEELEKSMDPIEETTFSDLGSPDDGNHSEIDFFSSIHKPTRTYQNHLLDRLNPPLVPSPATRLDMLPQHAQTDNIQNDADQLPKGDAFISVLEVSHASPPATPDVAAPLDAHGYGDWGELVERIPTSELDHTESAENERDHEPYLCFSDDDRQWVSLSIATES